MRNLGFIAFLLMVSSQSGFAQDAARPKLTAEKFAEQIPDYYYDSPSEVEELVIREPRDREFFLNNLTHLPNIRAVEFHRVEFTENDISKVANCPQIKTIKFGGYIDLELRFLRALPTIEVLGLARCERVVWRQLPVAMLPRLRKLDLFKTPIDASELAVVGRSAVDSLKFSDTTLDDDIVRAIADFQNLRSITVYNCEIADPTWIESLSRNLEAFRFTGPIGMQQLMKLATYPKLKTIELNVRERLDDSWFQQLAKNCPEMSRLALSKQGLNQERVASLSSLSKLQELEVYSGSELRGMEGIGMTPPVPVSTKPGVFSKFAKCSQLRKLRLSGTYSFGVDDGNALGTLSNLEDLQLRNMNLASGAFSQLGGLTSLKKMDLYRCKGLSKQDSQQIGKLAQLEELDLGVAVIGGDFRSLGNLKKLRELDLTGCTFFTDNDLENADGLASLERLVLKNNLGVTDKGIAKLGKTPSLKELHIEQGFVNGRGFSEWPSDHPLEMLFIAGCSILDDGFQALSKLENLKYLDCRLLTSRDMQVDVTCFVKSKSLEALSLMGSFKTSKASFETLTKSRPDLGVHVTQLDP